MRFVGPPSWLFPPHSLVYRSPNSLVFPARNKEPYNSPLDRRLFAAYTCAWGGKRVQVKVTVTQLHLRLIGPCCSPFPFLILLAVGEGDRCLISCSHCPCMIPVSCKHRHYFYSISTEDNARCSTVGHPCAQPTLDRHLVQCPTYTTQNLRPMGRSYFIPLSAILMWSYGASSARKLVGTSSSFPWRG